MNVIAATAYWGAFLLWGAIAPAGGAYPAHRHRTKRLLPFVF